MAKKNLPEPSTTLVFPWDDCKPIKKQNCKLCNSAYRMEAEELYDRTSSFKRVHNFLVDDRADNISYGAVVNHLKMHYVAKNNELLVKDYASGLDSWLGLQKNQHAGLMRSMAMIEREIMILAAMNEGLSLTERRKTDDTIVKMSNLLLGYRTRITDIEREQEPVTLIFQQLQIILKDEMQEVDSEETKTVLQNVVQRIKISCSEFLD